MELHFELQNPDGSALDDHTLEQLAASMGIADDELGSKLIKLARASIAEYIEMLVGKGMANRADEAKQDRLFYLIRCVFTPYLPAEDEISMMFQLTTTQAKTLLRNTISRYRTRLQVELRTTLESIFESAERTETGWDVSISSAIFVEHLNLIVAKEGPDYDPIRKRSVGTKKYFISTDTHTALGNYFGG